MSADRRITRRDLLRGALTGAVTLAIARDLRARPNAARPPNIIFFLADDLGYADVACYGRRGVATPNIDRLAARGTRFSQAYANSAVCTATRTALITGRYQYRLRVGLEEPLAGNPAVGLPPEHPTLPSLLKRAGYRSTLIGKWHLGALPKFGPLKSGYDHFYGFRGGALDYYSHSVGDRDDLWDDDVPIHATGYLTELLGARAVDVVRGYGKSSQPFLISLHFNAPHWPWEAPGDQAESARLRAPDSQGITHFDGGSQKTYERMIEAMDAQIGRVMRALEEQHLVDNTIAIFTSDNGGERFADTWPFTGKKTELLEGGLRVPSIISWPARIAQNRTIDQVSISMDWVPTLLAAAAAAPDPAFASDGMNLLPMLTDNAAAAPRKLFWRYKANAQRAMRDGNYKLLKIRDNSFLFDVVADPQERANLKQRHNDVYRRMEREWYAWSTTMLPEIKDSFTGAFDGRQLADHIGATAPGAQPDLPTPPED
jgi:arylsulfatase A-like enzyme